MPTKNWVLSEATLSIKSVRNFPFKATDKLFLDANVWFYIYFAGVVGQRPEEAAYSAAWKDILAAQSKVCIDALVVSEILNTHARAAYRSQNRQDRKFRNFKAFRRSPEFKSVAQRAALGIQRIVSHCRCTPIESGFSSLPLDSLWDVYAQGDVDFNDQILVEICRANGYLFVTHDGDFADKGIPVLTANRRMLQRAGQTCSS